MARDEKTPDNEKAPRRRYRRIEVRMWGDHKFKQLSPLPPCGQGLWVYLLTGPHTGPVPGVFRAGRASMAEDLGWEQEDFDRAFAEAADQDMVRADWRAKFVWVPKAIKYNRPESPNVVKSWGGEWDLLPECELKTQALASLRANIYELGEAFAKAFDATFGKASEKPSDMPPGKPPAKPNNNPSGKGTGNQEQDQDQNQEQVNNRRAGASARAGVGASAHPPTDDDDPPSQEGHEMQVVPSEASDWISWLNDHHQTALVSDVDRYTPIFVAWTKARITLKVLDDTIAECRRVSRGPINDLVMYVDRVFAARAAERSANASAKPSMADLKFEATDYRAGVGADGGF
ncbi:hypothetical protein E2P84_36700 [Burkholderia cepacia]|uniref:Uncharacterized protein n=1 Tax=Burkholderia cepacia TaxID=292 RepID=A0AAX2RS01_BURCE|nr:hypothetical protein [Burkholderia cepacia]TES65671.1 hypothetical protein E2P84_36700 [Burkholderia cepacia]TET01673.1 hypothetical protein E3D36_16695 [Burkholderia cepacia]TEU47531.1 hypothetical protein E3D37_16125 [Burkholderia cepacia]TEU53558.1 hypothetical protein E3D38_12515 [Burkholderia cepacia]TEV02164.1 hypothetical protein E3D40_13445 [Burkholderia cepacia]